MPVKSDKQKHLMSAAYVNKKDKYKNVGDEIKKCCEHDRETTRRVCSQIG